MLFTSPKRWRAFHRGAGLRAPGAQRTAATAARVARALLALRSRPWLRWRSMHKSAPAPRLASVSELQTDPSSVAPRSVIRVILQFCRENNLNQSFAALSAECQVRWCCGACCFWVVASEVRAQVSLNTVDNVDAFSADVAAGRWDTVLPQVALLWCARLSSAPTSQRRPPCRWRSCSCRGASWKSCTSTSFSCVSRRAARRAR